MAAKDQTQTTGGRRATVRLEMYPGGEPAVVEIDTATGCAARIVGPLYPADLAIVAEVVRLLREAKDRYPPSRPADG